MKKLIVVLGSLVIAILVQASGWFYSQDGPWLWDPSDKSWSYADLPKMVYKDGELALNPILDESFDIETILNSNDTIISINLEKLGKPYLTISYDTKLRRIPVLPDPPRGWIVNGLEVSNMTYIYSAEPINGTATFFIVSDFGCASLILDFAEASGGKFTLLGTLGPNESIFPGWPELGRLSESFSISTMPSP
jgi:hypothetical protein